MDEFTDGQEVTENQEQNTEPEETSDGQEQADNSEEQSSSLPSSTDVSGDAEDVLTDPVDQEEQDIPSDLEEAEQDAELTQEPKATPTPVTDYEELLEELKVQTEEIKAIRAVTDQQIDHNQTMENIGLVSIVGLALLCGFVAALIFSNYMRH